MVKLDVVTFHQFGVYLVEHILDAVVQGTLHDLTVLNFTTRSRKFRVVQREMEQWV